jgi:IS605 OrfB family transposase
MKLIAQVKLTTTPEESRALLQTMEQANGACNALAAWAWENKVFGQYAMHRERYSAVRSEGNLAAQVVVRCIGKVADAYKVYHRTRREFRPHSAIAYDDRILRWYVDRRNVSIWSVAGRLTLPFSCGEPQREYLRSRQGETDLVYQNGEWFLLATCDAEEPPVAMPVGVLGVDLGIVQVATDSLGNQYTGEPVNACRKRMKKLRAGLQSCGTKAARKHLRKARRKQSRYVRWVNHNISKQIVQTACLNSKAIALEALTGIRERASASKELRWLLGNWAFDQLRQFVAYKARRAGVPAVYVEARNTSRSCSACGYCDKANRRSQTQFKCLRCGFCANADVNAAVNIEARAKSVSWPMLSALA